MTLFRTQDEWDWLSVGRIEGSGAILGMATGREPEAGVGHIFPLFNTLVYDHNNRRKET